MELFLNNGRFTHSLPNTTVTLNEWNRVLVSVDLYEGIVRTWLNGELLPAAILPKDFMLDVIPSGVANRDTNFMTPSAKRFLPVHVLVRLLIHPAELFSRIAYLRRVVR